MVRRLIPIILILILHTAAVCSSNFPCLTWEIYQDRLRLICRTTYFLKPVALIDSHGKYVAVCSYTENVHYCNPVRRNALIEVDYSRKYIAFTIPTLDENVNGIWTCLQDEKRFTTEVSLSKGIIDSTEIHITGTLLGTTGHDAKHALNCFSCREPDGDNVEILVNGRTEDSITYNHDTGKCIHRRGKCHPDECNCTANEFNFVVEYEPESNGTLYTCDMLFTDSFNKAKFSTFSSVVFNGEGFSNKTSSVSIIKAGDKMEWNGIFTVIDTGISIEIVPTRTTQATVISDNNPVENKGGLQILYLSLAVFACVVGSLCAVCYIHFNLKSKRSIQGKTELEVQNVPTESVNMTEFSNNSAPEEQKLIQRSLSRKSIDSHLCDLYVTQTDQSKDRSAASFFIGYKEECIHYQGVTLQVQNRKCVSTNKIRRHFSLPVMQRDHGQI